MTWSPLVTGLELSLAAPSLGSPKSQAPLKQVRALIQSLGPAMGLRQDSESRGEEGSLAEVTDRGACAGMQKRQWEETQAVAGGPGECLGPLPGLRPQYLPRHMSDPW